MEPISIVVGILLLILAVFLVIAVLMQQGKSHNLSGTIAGGAETFFGKSKAQSLNKKLSVLTSIIAVVFVVAVLVLNIVQTPNKSLSFWEMLTGDAGEVLEDEVTTAEDTAEEEPEETSAEETSAEAEESESAAE